MVSKLSAARSVGYSGKPLRHKLEFVKDGMRILLIGPPENYQQLLGEAQGLIFVTTGDQLAAAHIFATDEHKLIELLPKTMSHIIDKGFVWVSWPKGSSKVPTDLNENRIRDLALSLGWVDTKVCAVDETWSGLKLMRRRTNTSSMTNKIAKLH